MSRILPPPSRRKLQFGEVFEESWFIFTRHSLRLIAAALVIFGFLALVDALTDAAGGATLLLAGISVVVTVVGVFLLQGALVVLVADLRDGKPTLTIEQVFQRVRPRLVTLIVAGLLAAFGIALGLVAFVIPGLVLLTFWSLITPAVVLEEKSTFDAFGRSMRLVRGNALRVFGVILVTVILATIINTVILTLLEPAPTFFDFYLSRVIANSVTVPFVASAWTVVYFELRELDELARQPV